MKQRLWSGTELRKPRDQVVKQLPCYVRDLLIWKGKWLSIRSMIALATTDMSWTLRLSILNSACRTIIWQGTDTKSKFTFFKSHNTNTKYMHHSPDIDDMLLEVMYTGGNGGFEAIWSMRIVQEITNLVLLPGVHIDFAIIWSLNIVFRVDRQSWWQLRRCPLVVVCRWLRQRSGLGWFLDGNGNHLRHSGMAI